MWLASIWGFNLTYWVLSCFCALFSPLGEPDSNLLACRSCSETEFLEALLFKHVKPQRHGFKIDEKIKPYTDAGVDNLVILLKKSRYQVHFPFKVKLLKESGYLSVLAFTYKNTVHRKDNTNFWVIVCHCACTSIQVNLLFRFIMLYIYFMPES